MTGLLKPGCAGTTESIQANIATFAGLSLPNIMITDARFQEL